MCERWRARDDDGGSFDRWADRWCQWDGVIVKVAVGLWLQHCGEMGTIVDDLMREDGIM